MASPAQVAANLCNAQFSTGPKTDDGKARSSRNAVTHGLNSTRPLIPGEDPVEFERFRQSSYEILDPDGDIEEMIVEELISIQWRLRRLETFEADLFSKPEPDMKRLQFLSLHGARLRRGLTTSLKDLRTLQEKRAARERELIEEQLADSILVREADLAAGRTTDFDLIGFVLKVEFVDEQIRRRDTIRAAHATLKTRFPSRRAA